MPSTLIKGGAIVTMDPNIPAMDIGDILIIDDRIAEVGFNISVGNDAKIINATDMIIMPGMVNGHIHTWQTGLRGLAGDWTTKNYLRAIHAGLATFFQPNDIYIANLVGALNQINNGVTTLVDWHHNNPTPDHSDAAIDGLEASGIRALFLHGSAKPDPKPGQKPYNEIPMSRTEVERLRKNRFAGNDGLLTMGIAVLGPQMSTNDVVLQDFRLAQEFDLIASLHHSGAKMLAPNGYINAAKQGLITNKINIVHGNALSDINLQILANHGATFTVTAEVEMQIAYGAPLTSRLRELNAIMAIGSDVECVYAPDMFAVMRTTLQVERHLFSMKYINENGEAPYPIPITTEEALSWATKGGASTAHLSEKIGSITPGKQADIVLLRANDLNLAGVLNTTNGIVLHANPGNIDTVMIAGKIRKQNGKLIYDETEDKILKLKESTDRIINEFKAKSDNAKFL